MDPISRQISAAAAGAGGLKYWVAKQITNNATFSRPIARSVNVDSTGNVYQLYEFETFGLSGRIVLVKYSKSGSVLWGRELSSPSLGTGGLRSVVFDGSDNVIVSGFIGNFSGFHWIKIDPNGNMLSNFSWTNSSGLGVGTGDRWISPDGQGGIWAIGNTGNLWRINNSGTWISSNRIAVSDARSIHVNPFNQDIYVGIVVNGQSAFAKLNSSYVVQYTRRYGSNGGQAGTIVEIGGNLFYSFTNSQNGKGVQVTLKCFSLTSNFVWARSIGESSSVTLNHISLVIGDNPIVGFVSPSNPGLCAVQYDFDGTLLWQRKLAAAEAPSLGQSLTSIQADGLGNYFMTGGLNSDGTDALTVSKLPSDGTRLGSSGGYTYSQISLETGNPGDQVFNVTNPTIQGFSEPTKQSNQVTISNFNVNNTTFPF